MSEKEDFSEETLEHISKLALLDLSTHPIKGLKNVFREDIPWKSLSNEEALKNAKHTKDGYFKASRVLKS